jgi:hypothetical protein
MATAPAVGSREEAQQNPGDSHPGFCCDWGVASRLKNRPRLQPAAAPHSCQMLLPSSFFSEGRARVIEIKRQIANMQERGHNAIGSMGLLRELEHSIRLMAIERNLLLVN